MKSSWLHFILFFFFLTLINNNNATSDSHSIIDTLPGYEGILPFKLETGYIGVGEDDEVQLFYYFIESEHDPRRDPLVLWITGGPGCSGFSAIAYEIGPLAFDVADFDGSLPSFTINQYSWTKVGSIIFIDSPVGTGFSYSTSPEGYASSDTNTAKYNYDFLRKWLSIHPSFLKNRLYIAGDSYGAKIVPLVALQIAEDNEAGIQPKLILLGYSIGNPTADLSRDTNGRIPYAHRMALISDEYYKLAKCGCDGEYVNPDPNNIVCTYALALIGQCINHIYLPHILEMKCQFLSPIPSNRTLWSQQHLEDPVDLLILRSKKPEELKCRNYNYVSSYAWANNETVQEALHIRKGTIADWKRCNKSIIYDEDVESVVKHHELLSEKGFQALVYSGDHDMLVPYMSTLKWIRELNLTLSEQWRPWTVESQIAGYTLQYSNNQAYLTFATIKGAGHTAPEYKPKEAFAMFKRWTSLYPL